MTEKKIDTGGPANPVPMEEYQLSQRSGWCHLGPITGATWLDVCAWHAMQGILAKEEDASLLDFPSLANLAYRISQIMLAEKRRLESE